MKSEIKDIEDEMGNVIGQIDESTMCVIAPNLAVDEAIAAGANIYMRRNGMRTRLSVNTPKKRRRRS